MLHRARIHPATPASELDERKKRSLWRAMRIVLSEAIENRGTSIQDYADAEGHRGRFQDFLQVYGREGGLCRICGGRIERLRLGGRSTFFCPLCQSRRG
jgi:formamidopyrimidine-DNA glycosylase